MEITIEEAIMKTDLKFVDVRTPAEYADASIPGAINIPLFDNRQHHQVGLIYKQLGETEARRAALAMVAPSLPAMVGAVMDGAGEKTPLLYCQRGGMRSLSLARVVELTGMDVLRLKGGFRAYRNHIRNRLAGYCLNKKMFVLHGLTGVGKTLVVKELEALGAATLDLEGIARHRGSVFGNVGLQDPRSQKNFETFLLQQLDCLEKSPYLVVEGEGRRIGNIHLPKFLVQAMRQGTHILLTAELDDRVQRILDEYIPENIEPARMVELKSAINSLRARLGNKKTDHILTDLGKRNFRAVTAVLCTDYYDQFYSDSKPESSDFETVVRVKSARQAALEIAELINNKLSQKNDKKTKGVLAG